VEDAERSVVATPALTPEALTSRVLRFIAAPAASEFDALTLAVHEHQYRANEPYRRFVDRHGATPQRWTEIPAVPASAFRDSILCCATGAPSASARVYESSGTTEGPGRRARHDVPDVAVYRAAALAGFARALAPFTDAATGPLTMSRERGRRDGNWRGTAANAPLSGNGVLASSIAPLAPTARLRRPFIVAAPERHSHPASSLGEMVTWLRETYDAGGPASFLRADVLDLTGLGAALESLDPARPIVLVAVTSALLRLVDHGRDTGRRWHLPSGSVVVDTGGCKGYANDIGRAAILDRYAERLGVAPDAVVNEYGMTELCSQLYARGAGPHRPPPWLRTLVCNPATGREQPLGEPGLLRHVDLANVGSVVAVQTDDVGRAVDGGVELLGRAAGAMARGCSLLVP